MAFEQIMYYIGDYQDIETFQNRDFNYNMTQATELSTKRLEHLAATVF